jgi:hypothetical protein
VRKVSDPTSRRRTSGQRRGSDGARSTTGRAAHQLKVTLAGLIQVVRSMPSRPSQLALQLPAPKRWGGRRDGAGRKPGKRPAIRHLSRQHFRRPLPAHVTLRGCSVRSFRATRSASCAATQSRSPEQPFATDGVNQPTIMIMDLVVRASRSGRGITSTGPAPGRCEGRARAQCSRNVDADSSCNPTARSSRGSVLI